MFESNIEIPEDVNAAVLIDAVERVCHAHGLNCTLKGTLVKYPGSVHWHFQKAKQKGTLEITWWENKNRLWFKVAEGRTGTWIDESMIEIKKEIQKLLG
ncbi:MAG TPA: hypothetical protein VFR47_33555 [Anaerolineales bacterium]|nr:hypothetical protein [Anaerolineales bacterium]